MSDTFPINCYYAVTDFVNISKPIIISKSYFLDADMLVMRDEAYRLYDKKCSFHNMSSLQPEAYVSRLDCRGDASLKTRLTFILNVGTYLEFHIEGMEKDVLKQGRSTERSFFKKYLGIKTLKYSVPKPEVDFRPKLSYF